MTPMDKEIIRGLADNDMNIDAVARSLYVHRNTVEYHIKRIKINTGLNAKVFRDLVELLQRIEG